jgi:glycosyltransferase involved in cell wall biosynthesis
MIVGVCSPVINWCGGAELVAVSIINALKEQGHQVIVLSNEPLNQESFKKIFNKTAPADKQIILPLAFFPSHDLKNVYTNALRTLTLKSKCQVVVDTFSMAVLPGVDISYIHHPLLSSIDIGVRAGTLPYLSNRFFFLPYKYYLRAFRDNLGCKLLANSEFTAAAIKSETGIDAQVLYPPVIREINNEKATFEGVRENSVVTVGRICLGKNLTAIPHIANLTRRDITFTIAGILESQEVMNSLLRLIRELGLSDRVRILTNVKRKQLEELLLSSKVYLHPKINEHFGISIVEAMSLGCTAVVHNSGGPREFVARIFRYNNLEEAAELVEKAIDDWSPVQARKTSESTERFDENKFSKQFADIFNSHFKR